MSTSPAVIRAPAATRWIWPIDLRRYDQSPELTDYERAAINAILKRRPQERDRCDRSYARLDRLLAPMRDALKITEASKRESGLVTKVMIRHMHKSRTESLPFYAVIFSSRRNEERGAVYDATVRRMVEVAR